MNDYTKHEILREIKKLTAKDSQNKVAKRAGVSSATISQMVNENWALIKDEMWARVRTNLRIDLGWQTAQTKNKKILDDLVGAAHSMSMSIAICNQAGSGKSHAYKEYFRSHSNVIYVECCNYWSKKIFSVKLLQAVGVKESGKTHENIEQFIEELKKMERPVVLFDQFDKLKDPQLDLFMDFYNSLEGHCGFVLSGVPALKKRILRGVQNNKIGYAELYSRIGRKFIALDALTLKDVTAICTENGVTDSEVIQHIYADCDDDLRRVRRSIEREKLKARNAA